MKHDFYDVKAKTKVSADVLDWRYVWRCRP